MSDFSFMKSGFNIVKNNDEKNIQENINIMVATFMSEGVKHAARYVDHHPTRNCITSEDIKKNEVIQESPYCTFKEKETKKSKVITRYTYATGGEHGVKDLVLGFGFAAMYNHSEEYCNAAYQLETVIEVMRHYAIEDIPADSEIFIDYGCGPDWGEDDYCV